MPEPKCLVCLAKCSKRSVRRQQLRRGKQQSQGRHPWDPLPRPEVVSGSWHPLHSMRQLCKHCRDWEKAMREVASRNVANGMIASGKTSSGFHSVEREHRIPWPTPSSKRIDCSRGSIFWVHPLPRSVFAIRRSGARGRSTASWRKAGGARGCVSSWWWARRGPPPPSGQPSGESMPCWPSRAGPHLASKPAAPRGGLTLCTGLAGLALGTRRLSLAASIHALLQFTARHSSKLASHWDTLLHAHIRHLWPQLDSLLASHIRGRYPSHARCVQTAGCEIYIPDAGHFQAKLRWRHLGGGFRHGKDQHS